MDCAHKCIERANSYWSVDQMLTYINDVILPQVYESSRFIEGDEETTNDGKDSKDSKEEVDGKRKMAAVT